MSARHLGDGLVTGWYGFFANPSPRKCSPRLAKVTIGDGLTGLSKKVPHVRAYAQAHVRRERFGPFNPSTRHGLNERSVFSTAYVVTGLFQPVTQPVTAPRKVVSHAR